MAERPWSNRLLRKSNEIRMALLPRGLRVRNCPRHTGGASSPFRLPRQALTRLNCDTTRPLGSKFLQ